MAHDRNIPPRPTPLVVIPENIPDELKLLIQWVLWRYFWDQEAEKWTKPPLDAIGNKTSHNEKDSRQWRTFEIALKRYQESQIESWRFDGIGVVLREANGLVGFDLDHCVDPATGEIKPWARKIVQQTPTYWEFSVSGTGLRGLGWGRKPGTRCRNDAIGFEMYTGSRYLSLTGHHLDGTPTTIEPIQEAINAVYGEMFPEDHDRSKTSWNGTAPEFSDTIILEAAQKAKNAAKFVKLFLDGDIRDYTHGDGSPDRSRADLALLCLLAFYSKHEEQLDRLFRLSALCRPKWESRADYRHRTITKAIESTPEQWSGPASNGQPSDEIHLTDVGNGLRLVHMFGEDLRYVTTWEKWLAWRNGRWDLDEGRLVEWHARQVIAELYRSTQAQIATLAQDIPQDEAAKKRHDQQVAMAEATLKWAHTSEIGHHIDTMVKRARVNPKVQVRHSDLDTDSMLFQVTNGTIDLRTGERHNPRRSDLITKCSPVAYDPYAICPTWNRFLQRIMGHPLPHQVMPPDERDRRIQRADRMTTYLKRLAGWSLTADVREQILLFLYGEGQNGKSTFLLILLALLGDYGMQAPSNLLLVRDREQHPTELADLFGKRFVSTIEVEKGKRLAMALVKALTGGEYVRARRMREDFWEFPPTWKIWLAANNKPKVTDQDKATWRRIKLIPFNETIPDEEVDKTLPAKLLAELPGILNWAIEGCLEWQEQGLDEPEEVTQATEAYREESDILGQFITDCCFQHKDAKTQSSVLMKAFETYAGVSTNRADFDAMMRQAKFQKRTLHGRTFWVGLGLKAGENGEKIQ
jgi:putative DNA primase/helicase